MNWGVEILGRHQTPLYRDPKISGTETVWKICTALKKEMKRQVRVNKQKAKQILMKELSEAKREDLGKLSNKLTGKIKASCKEKVNNLKAQNFTEYMSSDLRQR